MHRLNSYSVADDVDRLHEHRSRTIVCCILFSNCSFSLLSATVNGCHSVIEQLVPSIALVADKTPVGKVPLNSRLAFILLASFCFYNLLNSVQIVQKIVLFF